jgi:hypothetical protein
LPDARQLSHVAFDHQIEVAVEPAAAARNAGASNRKRKAATQDALGNRREPDEAGADINDDELFAALERYAKEVGMSKAEVVRACLMAEFGPLLPRS